MNLNDLLTKLLELQDKNERNTDVYFDLMKNYITSSAGQEWTNRHETVFTNMTKRVKDARVRSWIIFVFIVLILSCLFGIITYRSYFSSKLKNDRALVEFARDANLPLEIVKLDDNGNWLNVRIAKNLGDYTPKQKNDLDKLSNKLHSLGRIYDLNEQKTLNVSFENDKKENDLFMYITPNNSKYKIGHIAPKNKSGSIWPTSEGIDSDDSNLRRELNKPIEYISNSNTGLNFYLKINEFNKIDGKWQIQFKEGSKPWSKKFYINKTKDGILENQTILVTEPGWNGLYAINIGIGRIGGNSDVKYAWNVKSTVEQIVF